MKKSRCLIAAVLLVLILCAPLAAFAKPAPPANLMKIFTHFLKGEDPVEENEWSEVDQWLTELDKKYQGVRPELGTVLSAAEIGKFEQALNAFRDGIKAKQHERSHELFINLHKAFLGLLDDFDYKSPPLIYLVQNDIGEAMAGLKEGELDEVDSELKEVELFYGQALPALRARGMKSEMIEEFRGQMIRCKGALAANERKLLASELTKLQQLLSLQQKFLNDN